MIDDSTRLLLTGSICPLVQRVITWGELRAVHCVTIGPEDFAEMAAQLAKPSGVAAFWGAHAGGRSPLMVTVRRALKGE